ncbi:MAG TPA: cysteine hydrolase [Candidatus Ornithospirochaeta avicola]|uniref:Cysteine hydrolase n=1 Tax=Candidatus Ornithospirochaeta avicola TaxID=2840896 RepID=A0A9D1PU35_9SPIO|nr:cysteine hydrolase [Candidatus Ornithospirochaeta avicola]
MKSVLIVVDWQNDFITGSLGFKGAETLDAVIAAKIRKYRKDGADIIFTFDTHQDDYLSTREGKDLPLPHCIKGTVGHELYGRVRDEKEDEDIVLEKPTFGSLELASVLQKMKYEKIELCGLVSNICVLSNAVIAKAALPEAEIIIDKKATSSADNKLNDAALNVLAGLFIKIIS